MLTVAGLMVITLPRGSVLWALRPRSSPLHTLLLRLTRGSKHTPVDHPTSVEQPACQGIHPDAPSLFPINARYCDTCSARVEIEKCYRNTVQGIWVPKRQSSDGET